VLPLGQSPFLNMLSDGKVAAILHLMTRPTDTKLTPDVARELCQRAAAKPTLPDRLVALAAKEYVLGLKSRGELPEPEDTLAQEQVTAASKERRCWTRWAKRQQAARRTGRIVGDGGEVDVRLENATTSSLEALKAYSLGAKGCRRQRHCRHHCLYYQHAIQLDPNFALGYLAAGDDYFTLGN